MSQHHRYRKKPGQIVIAVQLQLDFTDFVYHKWGAAQHAKPGDWLVNNDGEIYTVDRESFAHSYQEVQPGYYVKTTPVWARVATQAGQIKTKEGISYYQAGDYLLSNEPDGNDTYCISAARFQVMYELDE
jgi:hypothetical protein